MKRKTSYKPKPKKNKAAEPQTAYGKRIVFFKSFKKMGEYEAKERAALSHDDRMKHLEQLRKMVFSKRLLRSGKWQPVSKMFKIMPPYTNEPRKRL